MKPLNRRENPRIDVRLRCYQAFGGTRSTTEFMGVTENISRNGVLLRWSGKPGRAVPPHLGEALALDIELPANHDFGRKCIHCQGTVVRVSTTVDEAPRVALSVSYMKFRDSGRDISEFSVSGAEMNSWTA